MGSTLHDVVVDEARLGSVIIKSMIKDYVRAGNGTLERWAPARQAARQDGEHQQRRVAGNNGMLPRASLPEFTGDQKRDAHRHMLMTTNCART